MAGELERQLAEEDKDERGCLKNTRGKACETKWFMRTCRVHAPGEIEHADDWPFDEGDQGPAEEAGGPAS